MPDTSKMTPAEYAAFTGQKSYPVGQQKAAAEIAESKACQAADADYVARFMRALEDPDMRLVTDKPHYWSNWGMAGKSAILAVVREGKAAIQARAKVDAEPTRIEVFGDPSPINPYTPLCSEPGCAAVATCEISKYPYCKTHHDAFPL